MKPMFRGDQIFLLVFWCASIAGWHHGTYNRRSVVSHSWQNRNARGERFYQTPPHVDEITVTSFSSTSTTNKPYPVLKHSFLAILIATSGMLFGQPQEGWADGGWMRNLSPTTLFTVASTLNTDVVVADPSATETSSIQSQQSPGWEAARMKRTAAMKELERQKIIKVDTDDIGNQFLELPWVPDRKVAYKSLSLAQRLQNEVSAGAFGEISKDALLHAVDTAKTRRQAKKKIALTGVGGSGNSTSGVNGEISSSILSSSSSSSNNSTDNDATANPLNAQSALGKLKDLYSGFPVVMVTSIPQGGMFFLVKKGIIEVLGNIAPTLPTALSSTVPIGFGVMAYWLIRVPAEVIKTQVQTGQAPNVREAFETAKISNPKGVLGLWKHYPVMLWLDIPFQIINFILYGVVQDAVAGAGFTQSILTRLFCGVTCGMASAAVTCPIDVCKTRIVSRDKAQQQAYLAALRAGTAGTVIEVAGQIVNTNTPSPSSSGIINQDNRIASSTTTITTTTMEPNNNSQTLNEMLSNGSSKTSRNRSNLFPQSSDDEGTVLMTLEPPATSAATTSTANIASSSSTSTTNLSPTDLSVLPSTDVTDTNNNVIKELFKIAAEEGPGTLFLGIQQRLLYVGLANGIRLAAYGTSRMDLMMRSLDDL